MNLDFDNYSVQVFRDAVAIYLDGRKYAVLSVSSPLNIDERGDVDEPLPEPSYVRYEDGVTMSWSAKSNLWPQKLYLWHFEHNMLWFQVMVKGRGRLHDLHFFEGSTSDFAEAIADRCDESCQFKCADVSMAPPVLPPLVYCLGYETGQWLGTGIAPDQGRCDFTLFEYVPGSDNFCFRAEYSGLTIVDGSWTSPYFIITPARTPQDAIANYCSVLKAWEIA